MTGMPPTPGEETARPTRALSVPMGAHRLDDHPLAARGGVQQERHRPFRSRLHRLRLQHAVGAPGRQRADSAAGAGFRTAAVVDRGDAGRHRVGGHRAVAAGSRPQHRCHLGLGAAHRPRQRHPGRGDRRHAYRAHRQDGGEEGRRRLGDGDLGLVGGLRAGRLAGAVHRPGAPGPGCGGLLAGRLSGHPGGDRGERRGGFAVRARAAPGGARVGAVRGRPPDARAARRDQRRRFAGAGAGRDLQPHGTRGRRHRGAVVHAVCPSLREGEPHPPGRRERGGGDGAALGRLPGLGAGAMGAALPGQGGGGAARRPRSTTCR